MNPLLVYILWVWTNVQRHAFTTVISHRVFLMLQMFSVSHTFHLSPYSHKFMLISVSALSKTGHWWTYNSCSTNRKRQSWKPSKAFRQYKSSSLSLVLYHYEMFLHLHEIWHHRMTYIQCCVLYTSHVLYRMWYSLLYEH